MDRSFQGAQPTSFADAYFRRWGIGAAQMRKLRLDHRCGYIACTRLVKSQELEAETGRREPHW